MFSSKLQLKKLPSAFLAATAIAGLLLLPVAPRSYANDHAKCQHAIEKAESNLDKAIHKHGEHSPEASPAAANSTTSAGTAGTDIRTVGRPSRSVAHRSRLGSSLDSAKRLAAGRERILAPAGHPPGCLFLLRSAPSSSTLISRCILFR